MSGPPLLSADDADAARPARQQLRVGYKDQRELGQLPERIAALDARLADPGLYAGGPAAAEPTIRRHAAARAERAALEDRWLELEERRAALEREAEAQKRGAAAR